MSERTLAIIKPDAVKKHAIGDIIARYEKAGLKPVAIRMMQLSKSTAEGFYAVHKARPFFEDRKSTRLNSSHSQISYAVFCLKKKKKKLFTCFLHSHRASV